ncbi:MULTISPECIES: hypothetical protein [unclassified Streptomyces]|uniref:hypothetical protein n=1 Tax=unclassified Streptomyces TaxID=2593676 RepID=UPI0013A6EB45|nr:MULTISPECIES: hypothetical protein [unclassified Streptomyces]QZZ30597.1 hypothetical protein A7X85_34115 [Streptomyces sp. ST1015]
MLGFAVGSLFPQLKNPEFYASWADEVERVLNLIPSINDLKITGGRTSFALFDTEGAERLDDLIHHPIPVYGAVTFTITIPSRVQSRLSPWGDISVGNKVEKFLVFIELDSDYPYTLIIVSGDEIVRPTGAVVVVREFLQEELAKLGDASSINLTTLGPSPFHAEFFVAEGDEGEAIAPGLKAHLRRGGKSYGRCDFFYDPAEFESPTHVLDVIRRKVGPEFAGFYRLTAEQVIKRFGMRVLTSQVEERVSSYRERGLASWFRRVRTSRSTLRDIGLELLEIQMGMTKTQQNNAKLIEELETARGVVLFESQLKDKSELDYGSELDSLGAMLKLLESQHTQTVQRLTAFAVSLLGVVVGAFLTAALRR